MSRDKNLLRSQFGLEATPGVAVDTVIEPKHLTLTIETDEDVNEFQPDGSTFVASTQKVAESTTVNVDGVLTVDEFGYLLASAWGVPASDVLGDANEHVFAPQGRANRKSLTFKQGDDSGAWVATGCFCQSLSYEVNHTDGKINVKAKFVGQPQTMGVLSTPANTPSSQVSPLHVKYFWGTTAALLEQAETDEMSAWEYADDDLIGQTQMSGSLKAGTGKGKHALKTTSEYGTDTITWMQNIGSRTNASLYLTAQADVPNHDGGTTPFKFEHTVPVHLLKKSGIEALGDGELIGFNLEWVAVRDKNGFTGTIKLVNGVESYTTVGGGAAPLSPSSLAATAGAGEIDLTWSASVGALSYQVWRQTPAGGSFTQVGTSLTTSYTDLTVDTYGSGTFVYYVKAVNGDGVSPASATDSVVYTAPSEPNAPGTLTYTTGTGLIDLNWSAPVGGSAATGYTVYRKTPGAGSFTLLATLGTVVAYTDNNVDAFGAGTFQYYVSAFNGIGSGVASNTVSVAYSPAAVPPETPGNPSVSLVGEDAVFEWDASATATRYYVEHKLDSNSWDDDGYVTGLTDTLDLTQLAAGTYSFRVRASNDNGVTYSGYSNVVTVVWNSVAPLAPTLNGSNSPTQISLYWSAPTGALPTGYRIYRKTPGAGSFTLLATVYGGASDHWDYDVNAYGDGNFEYKVVAYNAIGDAPDSNTVTVNHTVAAAPDAPGGVVASVVSGGPGITDAYIEWMMPAGASAGVTDYYVEFNVDGGTYVNVGFTPSLNILFNLDDGVFTQPYGSYVFRVRATNDGGTTYSPWASAAAITWSA